ncbi:MAG: beta-galactosidase [Patescibacteria group bacterium]|nr:beta-galactosidase [Patescibacteria group bacterium]
MKLALKVILAVVLIITLSVCFTHIQQVNAQTKSNEEKALESVSFPIMTWFGLRAEHFDLKHFQEMADAGFTINFSHVFDAATNKKALDIAQQAGIKLLIGDNRIDPDQPVDAAAKAKIEAMVAEFKDQPALFGYHVRDEPSSKIFENMGAIRKAILARDPNHLVYGNLYPIGVQPRRLGDSTYAEHVEHFMQIFQPKMLSYDHYPFGNRGFKPRYYENMEVIREMALKYKVPFWAFTMSCAIDPAYPEPKETWIRLQVFTDLAYGAKGIQYFTYGLPHSDGEKFTIAIVDDNGVKTYIYDIAKKINAEIHALAPVLKKLQSIAVYNTEPLPQGTRGIPSDFIIKKAEGNPAVIGYFTDPSKNQKYVMLTSRDFEKQGGLKLSLSSNVKGLIEISKTNGKELPAIKPESGALTVNLNPGDGRLFRIEE